MTAATSSPYAEPARPDARPTLLLVDDEPTNLQVLRHVLQADYQLLFALEGTKALALAREKRPDLILLDVMMPGISGHDVCRALKTDAQTAAIPVIFITALSDARDETVGFEAGAVDYMVKPISPAVVRARVRNQLSLVRVDELRRSRLEIVQRLGRAAEYKDNETGMHVVRMSHYAYTLARAIGVSAELADDLLHAAPMHDVGKIGIPDSILCKSQGLTDEEWIVMRSHTTIGADIIGQHEGGVLAMAARIALSHHEKWNGKGYPHGLAGAAIPLEARIVAIADVFDALVHARPYKPAWSVEQAGSLLQREAGQHFDPALTAVFLHCLPRMLEIREEFAETPGHPVP
ncbi:MAG TPA: HD domain-containing phosphohydrolase [Pseudorhodoferax sp.]|jgi:putative two-component system response regulator|nr:HD domain-containing phosphohydrolase [Pseudorhodoferax sp.]